MDRDLSNGCLHLLPFGIPTLLIADDPRLLAAARTAYAHWSVEALAARPQMELRLETAGTSSSGVSLDIRVEGSRLRVEGCGANGTAHAGTGKARATVPVELALDQPALTEVTDTLLLFLLARRGRTPVHASAFMVGDIALVLAGPSGSGKSSIALAAAERGLPVLTDDMVFVQLEPTFRVWGFPRPIHVYASDAPDGDHQTRLRSDKLKAAVPMRVPALHADRARLVLLKRGEAVSLSTLGTREAVNSMMRLESGFDLLEAESRTAIEALAASGPVGLTLSKNPAEAVELLLSRIGQA